MWLDFQGPLCAYSIIREGFGRSLFGDCVDAAEVGDDGTLLHGSDCHLSGVNSGLVLTAVLRKDWLISSEPVKLGKDSPSRDRPAL